MSSRPRKIDRIISLERFPQDVAEILQTQNRTQQEPTTLSDVDINILVKYMTRDLNEATSNSTVCHSPFLELKTNSLGREDLTDCSNHIMFHVDHKIQTTCRLYTPAHHRGRYHYRQSKKYDCISHYIHTNSLLKDRSLHYPCQDRHHKSKQQSCTCTLRSTIQKADRRRINSFK